MKQQPTNSLSRINNIKRSGEFLSVYKPYLYDAKKGNSYTQRKTPDCTCQ